MLGWDGSDGAKRREQHREQHLTCVGDLDREGRIILAGPIRSDDGEKSIGAVIVFEAADLAEAREIIDRDPYVVGGVYESLTVSPFKQVFPEPS
jgi:uncharacterized protein YciI